MKKIYSILFCVALLFAGCTQDFDEPIPSVPTPDGLIAINVSGSIDQVTTTRANDDGFCNGDGVGIYAVNYDGETPGSLFAEGNQATNVRYVFNEQEYKWTPDYPVYYLDGKTPVDLYGYYPYNNNVENVNAYPFEVQKDQSTDASNSLMGGYEASDFLWGKAENIAPTTSRIKLTFNHRMAGVQVELVEGNNWGENEWNSVDKHILVSNTIRKASIDLATGVVTPSGEVEFTDIIPAVNGNGWRAIVVPQSMEASVALFKITVNGTSYVFRKNEDFEYISGKLHKFTIEVSKKDISGIECKLVGEDITPWESETITHDGTAREYVVVNVPKASSEPDESALKAFFEEQGKDVTKIQNLKVTGEINANDFYFMRDEMLDLKRLNIEEVKIKSGSNSGWLGSFEENAIPDGAMYQKTLLERVILPKNITKIGPYAFAKTRLYNVYIPDSVTEIGFSAFKECDYLTSVNIPNSLIEIGDGAFNCVYASNKIVFKPLLLPSSLRRIGESAFSGCRIEGNLRLPADLEKLGAHAFENCGFSGDLVIPSKITEIPDYCFSGNYIERLTLPNGLMRIGDQALCGTGDLILPNSLREIGENAFGGSPYNYSFNNGSHYDYLQKFSGKLVIPESVMLIGTGAFANQDFSGTFEIPKNISIVPTGIVSGDNIKEIICHSDVVEIQLLNAYDTPNLKRIVCLAQEPPRVWLNGPDMFLNHGGVVEVPEKALIKYQQADGWKDLIPSVYRDFNIDNEQINALNTEFVKKTIIRAPSDMQWSITHKPDWVTVTPSSGSGKVEVTISFDEMARGAGNRADSLVFKPISYDYQKVIKLNQYDYQYGDGDVVTHQTATIGNGVNIVFMGDCFDAKDIADGYYITVMDKAVENFFDIEPYKSYREYFNVYSVVAHSSDSGLPTIYSVNQSSCFGSQIAFNGGEWNLKYDTEKCFEYACRTPTVDKDNLNKAPIVLILNSDVYAGETSMWQDNSAIAVIPVTRGVDSGDFRGLIHHEVGGHAFGKLADEYIYHGGFIDMCTCTCCEHIAGLQSMIDNGWAKNLSLNSNLYEVPWSHMIFDPQFQMYVDMYEGGYFHQRGVFRSEPTSCMSGNEPYYSAISRQAIVERIMEYAGETFTFEKFKEKDNHLWGDIITKAITRSSASTAITPQVNNLHNNLVIIEGAPELNF